MRIHITGASGSGTSTLGSSLAHALGYAFLDADHYFWLPTSPPFQEKRPKLDRLRMLTTDIDRSRRFVLAGSICGWNRDLEDSFDLIVFLSIPSVVRLERLRQREILRYGSVNQEFIDWAARYDGSDLTVRSRMLHECWLSERRCSILRLDGDMSNDERLEKAKKAAQPGATDNPDDAQRI